MTEYDCPVCGYAYDAEAADSDGAFEELSEEWRCPVCACEKKKFTPKAAPKGGGGAGDESCYICLKCGYRYEVKNGDPEHGVACGTAFKDVPADWVCPKCRAPRARFAKEG